MAAFKITSFAGIAPKLSARLLANDVGQEAKDVNLDAGVLTPVKDNSNVQQIQMVELRLINMILLVVLITYSLPTM